MTIPLPVIANVYRCTFNWVGPAGESAANVLHFLKVGGTPASVFADIDAAWARDLQSGSTSLASVASIDIIKLDGVSGTVQFATAGVKWSGNQTSAEAVIAPAFLVKHVTGVRGRANRGRHYQPFVAEPAQANGAVLGAVVTAEQTAWTAFLASMTALVTLPVVAAYDRSHSGAGAHATIITGYVVEPILGTMRRRQQRLR